MSDAPKRTESAELTLVSPRESLAPVSTQVATPEMVADLERARRIALDDSVDDLAERRRQAQDRDTMQPCPWCSVGLVTPHKRSEWLAAYPELEPPPPSQRDPDAA